MFYYLEGILALSQPSCAVIDCSGVGYQLTVSYLTSASLSRRIGEKVKLFTHLAVREDGIELFGFGSVEEKTAFNLLTSVSGVGPKAAMSILSTFTPSELAVAMVNEDTKSIARANGIGAKTAARIVLELRDKMSAAEESSAASVGKADTPVARGNLGEAAEALAMLGYDRSTVSRALAGVNPAKDVGEIIKEALKKLAR